MLVEFEQNLMVQTSPNFLVFWQKKKKKQVFQSNFWQSVDAILEVVSVAETIV